MQSITRRQCVVWTGTTLLLALSDVWGCGGHYKSSSGSKAKAGNYALSINPTSGIIAAGSLSDGSKIVAYGTKDASGQPVFVNAYSIETKEGVARISLDSEHRPLQYSSPKGTLMDFEWLTTSRVKLTVRSVNGQSQIQTVADPSEGGSPMAMVAKPTSTRKGRTSLKVVYSDEPCRDLKPRAAGSGVVVTVAQCGAIDAQAQVYVTASSDDKVLGTFPAYSQGNGTYVASVPNGLATTIDPKDICNQAATALSAACYLYTSTPTLPVYVCNALSAAIVVASEGLGSVVAAEFDASCLAFSATLNVFCTWVNVGPDPTPNPGSPNLASLLCDLLPLPESYTSPLTLTPYVVALPESVYGTSATIQSGGAYPSLTVDLGGKTTIRTLSLEPSAPAAGESYVGTADIFCLLAGTVVRMSIVGTDGYTDANSTTVEANQANGLFQLSVPGAEAGVRDVVTTTVTLPDGSIVTLASSLVFG